MRRPDPEKPDSLNKVRVMRRDPTEPEKRLWSKLRKRQLGGIKFRRQVWLAGYVADFYAAEVKLVIEVDGDDHAAREASDRHRTEILEREGFRVMRFGNADVMHTLDGVLEAILMMARETPSPSQAFGSGPSLSPEGERGQ
ncbi:endonuclease domain-containing protein [Sphingobium sp. Leaf26]|uniref:endonuclease domain-containing protein n=1 Tax=Sphingobium sp. Leaf26 TaxID=1735693 RepID=UPI000B109C0F|nr:endonuclease domain-containing protein [Sphingobium sp. Leaf26]